MSTAKKGPAPCLKFEPQTWRKNYCKNCFKTNDQHEGHDAKTNGNGTKNNQPKLKKKEKKKETVKTEQKSVSEHVNATDEPPTAQTSTLEQDAETKVTSDLSKIEDDTEHIEAALSDVTTVADNSGKDDSGEVSERGAPVSAEKVKDDTLSLGVEASSIDASAADVQISSGHGERGEGADEKIARNGTKVIYDNKQSTQEDEKVYEVAPSYEDNVPAVGADENKPWPEGEVARPGPGRSDVDAEIEAGLAVGRPSPEIPDPQPISPVPEQRELVEESGQQPDKLEILHTTPLFETPGKEEEGIREEDRAEDQSPEDGEQLLSRSGTFHDGGSPSGVLTQSQDIFVSPASGDQVGVKVSTWLEEEEGKERGDDDSPWLLSAEVIQAAAEGQTQKEADASLSTTPVYLLSHQQQQQREHGELQGEISPAPQVNGVAQTDASQLLAEDSVSPDTFVVPSSTAAVADINGDQVESAISVTPQRNILIGRHRPRPDFDVSDWPGKRVRRRRNMDEKPQSDQQTIARDDAMMEGTRMLIENLRDKISFMEERCDRLDREKAALGDLLSVRKEELYHKEEYYTKQVDELSEHVQKLDAENKRLTKRLNLPESERDTIRDQEHEIVDLKDKMEDMENKLQDLLDENHALKQEIRDQQLEMEEMHDQFREDEAIEFRDLQKELEATAKNCRILQFKLRKAERKNEQNEVDRITFEEKIRQLEQRFEGSGKENHIRELEEELRMAKEVSVRLHDELEMVEERRLKTEEEVDRLQDYLKESENRRQALQNEVENLHNEIELLQSQLGKGRTEQTDPTTKITLKIPEGRQPSMSKLGKEGSVAYDLEQLLKDLSDSLERENDLKEQLRYAEEENKINRKKMSDLEDENESINMQIQKMSSEKSRHLKRGSQEKEIITEKEHEMRMQMELAEQEIKVLTKKLNQMELDNENLHTEIKFLQERLDKATKPVAAVDDTRSPEERIHAMAMDIDELKWKLIQKDRHLEKLKTETEEAQDTQKAILKKSRSLDSDTSVDIKRQLELVQQEANVLKDKVITLEKENERLTSSKQLLVGRRGPSITADDAALKNIELEEEIKRLTADNQTLRNKIKHLEERNNGSRDGLRRQAAVDTTPPSGEPVQLTKEQFSVMRQQIESLETENARLVEEYNKLRDLSSKGSEEDALEKDGKRPTDMTKQELRDWVKDQDSEIRDLALIIKNREEDIDRLEEEINGYREDIDNMLETFRQRELELVGDNELLQQKVKVIENLLDLVTERAESAQSELEKVRPEVSKSDLMSERSASLVSAISDVSMGNDDVFSLSSPDPATQKALNEQLTNRIASLEKMLAEEREKTAGLSSTDASQTGLTDDAKLHEREKDIWQKELSIAQQELKEGHEQNTDLKERMAQLQELHVVIKKENQTLLKELDKERDRDKSEGVSKDQPGEEASAPKKTAAPDPRRHSLGAALKEKEPMSWRWEKQDMEKQIRDLKRKYDDLERQLRSKSKVKMGGAVAAAVAEEKAKVAKKVDKEEDDGKLEKLSEEIKTLKEEIKSLKEEVEKQKKLVTKADDRKKEIQETLSKKEKQWDKEMAAVEADRKSAVKEAKQKDDVKKQKDDIIKKKDSLIKEKEATLKDRDKALQNKELTVKQLEDDLTQKTNAIKQIENELVQARDQLRDKEKLLLENETKIRNLDETLRNRDERLREKDEVLEKINRTLDEKESEVHDMDQTIRQCMKKLDEREKDTKTLTASLEQTTRERDLFKEEAIEAEEKLRSIEKEQDKETAGLVIQREKLENQLDYMMKEKKCAADEIKLLRKTLEERDDDAKEQRKRLETDLKQFKEKTHSLEGAAREAEKVQHLMEENETLTKERNKLESDIQKLKRDLERSTKAGPPLKLPGNVSQREKEYQRQLEEKSIECKKQEQEIENLKTKLQDAKMAAATASLIAPPGGDSQPSSVDSGPRSLDSVKDISERLGRQELIFRAEKVGLEELYETRMRSLQEQLAHAQLELENMRRDATTQKELLLTSGKTLSEFKNKYDTDQASWNDQRLKLEKKTGKVDELKQKVAELQKQIDELTGKLRTLESSNTEVSGELKILKNKYKSEKVELSTQVQKLQEQVSVRSRFGERVRRETPADKEAAEQRKLLKECQSHGQELQKELVAAQKARETEHKELTQRLDETTKQWARERKSQKELDEKTKELSSLQKTLVDLQYKLHSYRESWLRERSELQRQLDETRRTQLEEKERYNELLSQVKKVKTLMPVLQDGDRSDVDWDRKYKGNTVIELSSLGAQTQAGLAEERLAAAGVVQEQQEEPFLVSPSSSEARLTVRPGTTAYIKISRRAEQATSSKK